MAVAFAALTLPGGTAGAAPTEPLKSSGRWITDADGRVVVLHGVNLVTKRAPHLPSAAGFGADDASYLSSEGLNALRLGFGYDAIEPAPGTYDGAFISAIADEAQVAADNGMLVLADIHQDQFTDAYNGNGFPGWMAIDDGQPNNAAAFPFGYFTNAALYRAYENFWNNVDASDSVGLQDHYVEGVERLATELSGNTGLLGYEVMNEPWPGANWADCFPPAGCTGPAQFDAALLTPFHQRAVAAIRAGDPRRIAFYEPGLAFDYAAPTGVGDLSDPNTGFSFHNYCFTGNEAGDPAGCPPSEETVFNNAKAHSDATGSAPLMTEFGATDNLARMKRLANMADRHMVGWNYWTYSNIFAGNDFLPTSLIKDLDLPPTPDNIKQPAMDVLARPYPQLVAGTPKSWSWAPLLFELEYSTTGPTGKKFPSGSATEVFMPARHFSSYDVRVIGARVVSEEGAKLLRLESCPGASEVSVQAGVLAAAAGQGGAASERSCDRRCGTRMRLQRGSKRQRLLGTSGGDRMIGNRDANRLLGRGGSDCIDGGGGPDVLKGGAGRDRLKGGAGRDRLNCGPGKDLAVAGTGDKVSGNCEKVKRRK
jgi:endoglycosylceramidase